MPKEKRSYDEIGNTIFLTDDAGTVAASYSYTPYGVSLASSGSVENRFRFQGAFGVMDDGGGLYYMRARTTTAHGRAS